MYNVEELSSGELCCRDKIGHRLYYAVGVACPCWHQFIDEYVLSPERINRWRIEGRPTVEQFKEEIIQWSKGV